MANETDNPVEDKVLNTSEDGLEPVRPPGRQPEDPGWSDPGGLDPIDPNGGGLDDTKPGGEPAT